MGSGAAIQQELPAVAFGRRLAEGLEVAVVEHVHAEVEQREVVDGARQLGRCDVGGVVAAHQRDVPFLEPRDYRGVQPRGPAPRPAAAQPRALGGATGPDAGADEQGVAGGDPHARVLLPRLEVLDVDRRPRLQVRHALQPGDVDEDAAGHDAALQVVDGVLLVPVFHDGVGVGRVAVVEDAVVVDVGEGVEMGVGDAVIPDGDAVRADADHLVLVGIGVVDGLDGVGVAGQRHGYAVLDQGHRLQPLGGRDEVQRPDLVVGAPPPPVGELRLPLFVLRLGDRTIVTGGLSRRLGCRQRCRQQDGHRAHCLLHRVSPRDRL